MSRYSKYGITQADFELMLFNQGGRCAICQEQSDKLVIDHDHEQGNVRSLLCTPCNTFVGYVEKRGHNLGRIQDYIELHKTPAVSELQVVGRQQPVLGRSSVLSQVRTLHQPRVS